MMFTTIKPRVFKVIGMIIGAVLKGSVPPGSRVLPHGGMEPIPKTQTSPTKSNRIHPMKQAKGLSSRLY